MSFLASTQAATASSSRTWLPILGILEEDPSRSRATLANARNSHCARQFRESNKICALDSGAVFDVYLYEHPSKGQFAVKRTKKQNPRGEPQHGRHGIANSTVVALREIQVGSHSFLQNRVNVVDLMGWDWDEQGTPVLFTPYAEEGTLKDFVRRHPEVSMEQRRLFALDIACGLHALHVADIAHGDVKLANTLVFPAQREASSWIAKVSDFSHSVFGISSRRGTTYLGSRLYNAPEVRRRADPIPSDQLPRCESFSYGLLVWELLKNGDPYPDPSWVGASSSSTIADSSDHLIFLDSLRQGELLDLALGFLCREVWVMGRNWDYSATLFHTLFTKTLQEDPKRRSDLQAIAMMLDYCDSADIAQLSRNASITSMSVWDFNPWDGEPWPSRCQFVREIETLLSGPLQPNHAELHLLLSRCYAEEYGVSTDIHKAANHLYEAANSGSLEANWILKLCRHHIAADPSLVKSWIWMESRTSARGSISALEELRLSEEPQESRTSPDRYIGLIRQFNSKNTECGIANGFTFEANGASEKYSWGSVSRFLSSIETAGRSLCDTVVSVTTFQAAASYIPFLEAAASFGWSTWSLVREPALLSDGDFTDTSYRSEGEFFFRLLLAVAKAGQRAVMVDIIDGIEAKRTAGKEFTFESPTGESPLHYLSMVHATKSEIETLIQDLIGLGFDIDQPVTARSWIPPLGVELYGTPLQVAIRFRCMRTVAALVHAGADVTLARNETLSPLSLATSLNCYSIVDFLLPFADAASPGCPVRAAKALGVPSRKGWYDDLMSDFASNYRGFSLVSTGGMYLRYYRLRGQHAVENLYDEIDGAPLIESISRGQRNLGVLATLIEMGFYPRTPLTRWKLLESVLALSKDDPIRNKMLALLFCRREIEAAGAFKQTGGPSASRASTWIDGWPSFFVQFPDIVPDANKLPILHLLVRRDEGHAILHILSYFRFLADGLAMLRQVDYLGHDAGRTAYQRRQMAIYAILRKTVWTFGKDVDTSRRGWQLRDVSQESIDDRASALHRKKHPDKPARRPAEPFRLRRLGPIAQDLMERERAVEPTVGFEVQAARRTFEKRIAALIHADIGNLQVAEEVENYAVWVFQNEIHGLAKAEELCVLANILRIEVREQTSGRILDRSDAANWSAPGVFRQLYAKSPFHTESPGHIILQAYKRLEDSPPCWIPNIMQQTNHTGPEAILEWFRNARFQDAEHAAATDKPSYLAVQVGG